MGNKLANIKKWIKINRDKVLIYFSKIWVKILRNLEVKRKIIKSFMKKYYHYIIIFIGIWFLFKIDLSTIIEIDNEEVKGISYVFASIIGGSVAIIFSFSVFNLQK